MILKAFGEKFPNLHPTVRIADNAAVIGDVTCGENVSIWYGSTVRGDMDSITIGANTNIQDGCILHCDSGAPVTLGEGCVVGHGAIIHSCTVGDGCMIGMGAILLSGCEIGDHCIIGAGALVTGKMKLPPYSMAVGSPAKIVKQVTEEQVAYLRYNTQKYVKTAREELDTVRS